MTTSTLLRSEFLLDTRNLSANASASADLASTASAPASLYQFEIRLNPELRVGYRDIDEIVNELSADPDFKAALPEARAEVARGLYGDVRTLASLRLLRGLSQSELAQAVETSQPAIAFYESGKRQPMLDTAKRIADVLQISLDELYDLLNASQDQGSHASTT